MKRNNNLKNSILLGLILFTSISCERDLSEDAVLSTFSKNPDVFIDAFSPGLGYGAFGGSKYTAFTVDTDVKYQGTASMRFDVPNEGDPQGAYAGGVFIDGSGRNLTDYDALTFWVKGSQGATLNEIGLGTDFGDNKYNVMMKNVSISTNWQKVIIPIPDASKLVQEKGQFWYSEGPENGLGYTFWIDNLKYEKLGTIAHPEPSILNGLNKVEQTFIGSNVTLTGLTQTFNMPTGVNQTVIAAPGYFTFKSSDPTVATVNELGKVSVVGSGTTVITAKLGGKDATGSLTLTSLGVFTPAPTPTKDASNVISIFSDAYTNVPVEYYNGYWAPYQTTQGQADININGDNIIKYSQFNFVGVQFSQPTINATQMTHLHVDVQVQNTTGAGNSMKIALNDFGSDNAYGGGNDSGFNLTVSNPSLPSGSWVSFDIPLSSFTGLTNRANLAQIVFESATGITGILVDNIYLYKVPTAPTTAAPTPTVAAANVISVFSDAYTNIASNLNPNWGQATVVTQVPIASNNTLRYGGLNYQGLEFGASQNLSTMTTLHIDYYSANSTSLKAYLISPGPVEKAKVLTVPTAAGWNSIEIPLSNFSPVNLANVFQMKFDGNGDIYLDNIYFHN
jgi:hypothetical protein